MIIVLLVIIFTILVFLSLPANPNRDRDTIFFLVTISIFGAFIWSTPNLPIILRDHPRKHCVLFIAVYVIFFLIVLLYLSSCCYKHLIKR